MKWVIVALLVIDGAIHAMGSLKAFELDGGCGRAE